MNRYLKIALSIAFLSILISGGVLLLLFFPDIIKRDASSVSIITSISTAISAIFGLVIGTLAILALINAEKSESKSIEKLKIDLASITNTFITLRNRSFLYTNTEIIDYSLDVFSEERKILLTFLNSPSGFALFIWSGKQKKIEDFQSSILLCGLVDILTLKIIDNPQGVLNDIIFRTSKLISKNSQISEKDFKDMSKYLNQLGEGLSYAQKSIENDIFSSFAKDFEKDLTTKEAEKLKIPSEDQIDEILKRADEKIGGKSKETVLHFLNKAKKGGEKELLMFFKLIRELKIDK